MIKSKIKSTLYRTDCGRKLYVLVKNFKNCNYVKVKGTEKRYPEVLQMPITSKCNSNCVMCNIPHMDKKNEMTAIEFKEALKDPIFKNIKSIGINGGEPFLLKNLDEYVEAAILSLPKLTSLNIISNGFLTDTILMKTKTIYSICKKYNKRFEILFSLDGYGKVHDEVRRIPGAFSKVEKTIKTINENLSEYADSLEVGCTVVKQNVNNLIELDTYCKLNKIKIKYRLGIANKRIDSIDLIENFSVLGSPRDRQAAEEFFFSKYLETQDIKYYAIFNFLKNGHGRLIGCSWKKNGITMDPKGNIYYCAVASEKIGNIKNRSGKEIFFNKKNLKYRGYIVNNECDKCIHDYVGNINFLELFNYYKLKIIRKKSMWQYKRSRFI